MDYPALSFPHMYLLHGGYSGFLAQQGNNGWCTGPHLRLDDISRLPELRSYTSEQRSAWHLARMSRSVGHIPAAAEAAEESDDHRFEPREVFDDEMEM